MAVQWFDRDQEYGTHGPALVDLIRESATGRGIAVGDVSRSYLENLTRRPLDELKREPALVATETSTVETELINLCFREYPTFVSVHKCSAAVQAAFDDFDTSLRALMGSVPSLEEECRAFVHRTRSTQNSRSKAALVQDNQDKLLDLVEIPRLMETSVRNGYYQEAMELAAHARDLRQRHPGVPLIESTYAEVENVAQVMLAQLVSSLREPVKLPILIKAVGYLRRLGSMEEDELGVIFLISRLHNFQAAVQQIERERDDAVRYLRRYIDLFREHIYDIISQYSSIFQDSSLLASFSQRCIDNLIQLIRTQVPRMGSDTASLSSILVQLGYCAASFSRVGLDFTALVTEPFLATISESFSDRAEKATSAFVNVLLSPAALEDPTSLTSQVYSSQSNPSEPQLEIASFPALAQYVNEYLSSLNALRLLAPFSVRTQLSKMLASSIETVSGALLSFAERALDTSDPKAAPASSKLWRRSSDAMMTLEVRTVKREQCKRITTALLTAFRRAALPLIRETLQQGVYDSGEKADGHLSTPNIRRLDAWLQANDPASAPGQGVSSDLSQSLRNGDDSEGHAVKSLPPATIAEEEIVEESRSSPTPGNLDIGNGAVTGEEGVNVDRGEIDTTVPPTIEGGPAVEPPQTPLEAQAKVASTVDDEAESRVAPQVPGNSAASRPIKSAVETESTDGSLHASTPGNQLNDAMVARPGDLGQTAPNATETEIEPTHVGISATDGPEADDTLAAGSDLATSSLQTTANAMQPSDEQAGAEQDLSRSLRVREAADEAATGPESADEVTAPASGLATPSEVVASTSPSEAGDENRDGAELDQENGASAGHEADTGNKKKKKKKKGKK